MDDCRSNNITKLKIQTLLGFNDFFLKKLLAVFQQEKNWVIFGFFSFPSVNLPSFQYHQVEEERKLAWHNYLINVECFCKFEKKIYNQLVPLSFYMVSST
jgi:hypothetical protein